MREITTSCPVRDMCRWQNKFHSCLQGWNNRYCVFASDLPTLARYRWMKLDIVIPQCGCNNWAFLARLKMKTFLRKSVLGKNISIHTALKLIHRLTGKKIQHRIMALTFRAILVTREKSCFFSWIIIFFFFNFILASPDNGIFHPRKYCKKLCHYFFLMYFLNY